MFAMILFFLLFILMCVTFKAVIIAAKSEYRYEKMHEYLTKLGNSPVEISKNLNNLGIKGEKNRANSCPISVYLYKKTNEACSVSSDGIIYTKYLGNESYVASNAIWQFISRFDDGDFPELEETSTK